MGARAYELWTRRQTYLINTYPLDEWKTTRQQREQTRQQQQETKRQNFFREHNLIDTVASGNNIHSALSHWAQFSSWTYCNRCKLLIQTKLLPSFKNKTLPKVKDTCDCLKERYIVPKFNDIPLCLRNLSLAEIVALRPFVLHTGDYAQHQHGYRQKQGFCRVSWSELPVPDKIQNLPDAGSRFRCTLAYHFLMTFTLSRYKYFVELRDQ